MCKVQLVTSGSRQAPIGQIITSVQISHLMLRCALLLSNFNCWNTLNIFKKSLSWIFIKLHAPYRVNLPLFLLPGLSKNQGSEHMANTVNSKRKYKVFLIKPQRLHEIQVAEAEEWRGVMKDHVETLIWFYRLQIGNFTTPKLNVWIFTHSLVTGWLIVFFQTLQIY